MRNNFNIRQKFQDHVESGHILPKKEGDFGIDDCGVEDMSPTSKNSVTSFSHQMPTMPLIDLRRAASLKYRSNEKIKM